MAALTINGNLIIDEAASLQTSGTDNDAGVSAGVDNEVAWSYLLLNMSSALQTELGSLGIKPATGEESGDTSAQFPQVATRTIGSSNTDFIQLGTNTVTDLQFSDSSGNTITDGTATQIFATHNGAQIFLYADFNNNILLGREGTSSDGGLTWTASSTGAVAFAIVLDETITSGNVTGGNVWTIQYEALKHTNTSGVDDADTLNLSGLVDVKATFTTTTTVNFGDFSHVPSGSDDWSAIEQTATAGTDSSDPDMVITGLVPGSKVTVSTQGLGNNSQALNPGDAVRVDVVNHVNYPDFPLTNPDVHDLSKLSYTTHVGSVTEASFSLTQVNPGNANTTVKVHIYAFNETNDLQGANLVSTASVGSGGLTGNDETLVPILGNTIEVYSDLAKQHLVTSGITITAAGDGSYFIDGLKKNYTVDFQVAESSHMDRFVVANAQPTSGSGSNVSFDAGNFTFSVANTTSGTERTGVGGNLLFEDDGPTISLTGNSQTVTDDESDLATNNSGNFSGLFSVNYGADGAGSSPNPTYGLSTAGGNSNLVDTATGKTVVMLQSGANVVGVAGTTLSDPIVFVISVDSSTGIVTLDQQRAVVHPNANDPNDSVTLSGTNLVKLTATATDGDGDPAAKTADITSSFKFLDDGPAITVNDSSGTYSAGAQGTWTEAPGADGLKSLSLALNSFEIDTHGTVTATNSNSSLIKTDNFHYSGSITGDFTDDGIANSQTVQFTLTFDPNAGPPATYDFELTTPPASTTTISSANGSLDAGGPDPVRTLTIGSSGIVFSAVNATTNPISIEGFLDASESQIQTNATYLSSAAMNVSTSGIGLANNNFDGNAEAGVDGIVDKNGAFDESFVVDPTAFLVSSMKIFIDNSVGGYDPTTEGLFYRTYTRNADNSITAGAITKVASTDLHPEAGGQVSFVIPSVDQKNDLDAVQLFMGSGTVKVPVIEFSISTTINPEPLNVNFTATITDGDNDTKSDPFSIHVANA
ncbi:DUF5801 repeats-in-toxin domain-containing protein [Bradyrhizobium nanningense]|uniref:DUF5801 repeats-in-toxin domain-containing protein n=1 Tax=Bradyrhizobium nanningense TaxID=1325118 RepID=UPI001008DFB1|nr:DUF5801 repeats-in-toxin domain-containing protein [Bradyrhizobium nanningense]